MYFADFSPCSYNIPEPKGLSVGWLDKAHEFVRGDLPAGFIERLTELCTRPVVQHRGFHVCEFCDLGPDPTLERHRQAGALSSGVIRVVARDGAVYHSPTMIQHYVMRHGYRPPDAFVHAVMEADDRPRKGSAS